MSIKNKNINVLFRDSIQFLSWVMYLMTLYMHANVSVFLSTSLFLSPIPSYHFNPPTSPPSFISRSRASSLHWWFPCFLLTSGPWRPPPPSRASWCPLASTTSLAAVSGINTHTPKVFSHSYIWTKNLSGLKRKTRIHRRNLDVYPVLSKIVSLLSIVHELYIRTLHKTIQEHEL